MWYSYFRNIENKYSLRISLKKTLIIRVDGKNITKSYDVSLIHNSKNSFLDCFTRTVKNLSFKYNCLCYFGSDEANFIFENPKELLNILNIDKIKDARVNEIVVLFTQDFFDVFNSIYNNEQKVFWHGMCFSIEKEKINSYIKCRTLVVKDVISAYFLKRMKIKNAGKIKMEDRIAKNEEYKNYNANIKEMEEGTLYLNGNRIDKDEFLRGNIEIIKENMEDKQEQDYFDITKWEEE